MDKRVFDPEVALTHAERGQLAQMTSTEGYTILHRIMRGSVDRFLLDLINADSGQHDSVLASHNLAKAAAQFYAMVTERINHEVTQYTRAPRGTDIPVDPTEQLLDLGALASKYADLEQDRDSNTFDVDAL